MGIEQSQTNPSIGVSSGSFPLKNLHEMLRQCHLPGLVSGAAQQGMDGMDGMDGWVAGILIHDYGSFPHSLRIKHQ